jgi:hypothetical protein
MAVKYKNQVAFLLALTSAFIAVVSRVVDRDEGGRWILWKKSYLPDGYNYILEAININTWSNQSEHLSELASLYPGNSPLAAGQSLEILNALDARPIYPLITSFFLNLNFEIAPLVAPILSWLVLNILIYRNISSRHGIQYAVIIVTIFTSSFYMRYNFIGTTTDAIAALFTYLSFHYLFKRKIDFVSTLLIVLFILIAILTRPVDPIILVLVIGIAVVNFRRSRILAHLALPFVLLVAHLVYIQVKYHQLSTGGVNTGGEKSSGYFEYLIDAATKIPKIVLTEFAFLAVNDSIFFLLIIWTIALLFFKTNRILVTPYILVFLSVFYLAALNGTVGSGFRYQLPIIMFGFVVIQNSESPGDLWKRVHQKFGG